VNAAGTDRFGRHRVGGSRIVNAAGHDATSAVADPAGRPFVHAAVTVSRRRLLVLSLAGVTAATEAAFVAGLLPRLQVAGLGISPSLLPALVLAIACGSRLLGRARSRRAATWYWIGAVVLIPLLGIAYWRTGHFTWYPGLVASALGEELVYRLAIPAVIGAALRLGKVRPPASHIAGLVGAGLWFVLLPGHREQMTSPAAAIPFLAFAALSALVVYRSGSVLPMAMAHAISNLFTILMWQNDVASGLRSAAVGSVLLLLMVAYGRTARITIGDDGHLVDTRSGLEVATIDLRDGQPASVELVDGTVVAVEPSLTVPVGAHARPVEEAEPVEESDDDIVPAELRAVSDASRQWWWERREVEELGQLPRTVLGDHRHALVNDHSDDHGSGAVAGPLPHGDGVHPLDDVVSGVGLHHPADVAPAFSRLDRISRVLGLDEPEISLA
jgi:hypothetical protein